MRKLVYDENCQQYQTYPPNVINAEYLLFKNWRAKGLSDPELLKLATEKGYTLVTKDKGLVILAVQKSIEIIYVNPQNKTYLVQSREY